MNFNATFFVQFVHIFIGYIILERLFIRPWVRVLTDDLNQKKELEALIQRAHDQVTLKEKYKEEQWREFQVGFAQTIPNLALEPEQRSVSHESMPQKTPSYGKTIIIDTKEIIHSLVTRLTHE